MPRTFQIDQMQISVYPDSDSLGAAAADAVLHRIQSALAARGAARVIFATGNSQLGFLQHLIARASEIDWTRVTAFHLDEYVNLPETHPASFRGYLREKLFNHLDFAAVHLLDGNAPDLVSECTRYSALLDAAPIDVACVGIGENGHLAFNDPPADFATPAHVHVVTLDEACRRQQVGEGHFASFEAVPTQALSLTVPMILAASSISCVAPEARKAQAVYNTLLGEITPDCPASIMRRHADCHLLLDTESAALLPGTVSGQSPQA